MSFILSNFFIFENLYVYSIHYINYIKNSKERLSCYLLSHYSIFGASCYAPVSGIWNIGLHNKNLDNAAAIAVADCI